MKKIMIPALVLLAVACAPDPPADLTVTPGVNVAVVTEQTTTTTVSPPPFGQSNLTTASPPATVTTTAIPKSAPTTAPTAETYVGWGNDPEGDSTMQYLWDLERDTFAGLFPEMIKAQDLIDGYKDTCAIIKHKGNIKNALDMLYTKWRTPGRVGAAIGGSVVTYCPDYLAELQDLIQ